MKFDYNCYMRSIVYKDPVCGMIVEAHTIEIKYSDFHFAFCSNQCRERFLANPHLYIGYPGHKAPKQRGVQVVKRRHFRLEQPLTSLECDFLTNDLRNMVGIHEVHVDGTLIEIAMTYDLMVMSAEQIEARLAEIGLKLGEEWSERLRRGFVNFLEEFEVLGLEEPSCRI